MQSNKDKRLTTQYQLHDIETFFAVTSNPESNEELGIDNLISIKFKELSTSLPDQETFKIIHFEVPRIPELILTATLITNDNDDNNLPFVSTANNNNITSEKVDVTAIHEKYSIDTETTNEDKDIAEEDETEEKIIFQPPKQKRRKIKEFHEEIRQKLVNKVLNTVLGKQNEYYCTNMQFHALLSALFEDSSFENENAIGTERKQIKYWKRKYDWSNTAVIPYIHTEIDEKHNNNNIIITLRQLPLEVANILLSSFTFNFEAMIAWLTSNNMRSKLPTYSHFSTTDKTRRSFVKNILNGNFKSLLYVQSDPEQPSTKYKLFINEKHRDLISVPWIMYLIRMNNATAFGKLEEILVNADVVNNDQIDQWKQMMQFPTLPLDWNRWKEWYKQKVIIPQTNIDPNEHHMNNSEPDNVKVSEHIYIKKRILSSIGRRICWTAFLLETARVHTIHSSVPTIYSNIDVITTHGIPTKMTRKIDVLCSDCCTQRNSRIQSYIIKDDILKKTMLGRSYYLLSLLDSVRYLTQAETNIWFTNAAIINSCIAICNDTKNHLNNIYHIFTEHNLDCRVLFSTFDKLATKNTYDKANDTGKWLSIEKMIATNKTTRKNLDTIFQQVTKSSVAEVEKQLSNNKAIDNIANPNSNNKSKKYKMNILNFFHAKQPSLQDDVTNKQNANS